MLKQILPYLLLAVALVLLFMLWQSNRELAKLRTEDNRRAQEVIAKHLATAEMAGHRADSIQAKRILDSVSYKSREMGLKIDLERSKKTIARLRPEIIDKIDSFPDLRAFVAAQDSMIQQQDSLIRSQDLFCAAQIRDFNEILTLHQQKFEAQAQIIDVVTEQLATETRQHRKTKRRSALKSVGLGILSAGIVIISLKE